MSNPTTARRRPLRSATALAALVAALAVSAPAPGEAQNICQITYRMTTAAELASILMTSGYSAANGEFVGEFGAVECTNLSPWTPIFNDNEGAELLGLTFFAPPFATGPLDLAVCNFAPNAGIPSPGDFVSDITTAVGPTGQPVAIEVIVSQIICGGGNTTTSSTSSSTSLTVTTSSSTTSTSMPASLCGDRDGDGISATDALIVLQAATGVLACDACICDVDGSGTTAATDALIVLQIAVGGQNQLNCPPCT